MIESTLSSFSDSYEFKSSTTVTVEMPYITNTKVKSVLSNYCKVSPSVVLTSFRPTSLLCKQQEYRVVICATLCYILNRNWNKC